MMDIHRRIACLNQVSFFPSPRVDAAGSREMAIQPTDHDRGKLSESGIYTIPFAARLLSARPERVRSWVEGYGKKALPVLIREGPTIGGRAILSFLDLVECAWVRRFQAMGYSPRTIRKVALKLQETHETDHPFAWDKRFRGDGKSIFEDAVTEDGERRVLNLMNDDFELADIIEPSLFAQIVYVNDLAREFIPSREHDQIICDPKIAFGRPVIRGTQIPTVKLYKAYLAEGGVSAVADDFNIPVAMVQAAVRFELDLNERALH